MTTKLRVEFFDSLQTVELFMPCPECHAPMEFREYANVTIPHGAFVNSPDLAVVTVVCPSCRYSAALHLAKIDGIKSIFGDD